MHPKISSAAWSRVSNVRACTHPALMGPMSDSVAALSHGDDMEPMEGLMLAARIVLPSGGDACWEPWPGWRMQPLGGRRPAIAILGAPSAGSAAMRGAMDQPTVPRDHMSMTTAGWIQP